MPVLFKAAPASPDGVTPAPAAAALSLPAALVSFAVPSAARRLACSSFSPEVSGAPSGWVGVVLYMKGIAAKSEWEKVEESGRKNMYGGLGAEGQKQPYPQRTCGADVKVDPLSEGSN